MELDVMNSESPASASASASAAQQSIGRSRPAPATRARPGAPTRARPSAAAAIAPLLHALFGKRLPVRFEFWDGSALGPRDGPGTIIVRSPTAVKRMLWAPGELGLGRAYVTGELEAEGDVISLLPRPARRRTRRSQDGGPHAACRTQGSHTVRGPRRAAGTSQGGGRAAREAPFEAA